MDKVVEVKENQLVKVVNESGLDKTKAQVLLDNFSNYFEITSKWEATANALIITDVSQKAEMKMAREGRLFLREKRIAVEKTRKQMKEGALREGQTIDAIAKVLTNLIIPIEEDLEQKEKFAEIQEEKRLMLLKETRAAELASFTDFIPSGINLGSLDEQGYQVLLNGAKLQKQAKIEADAKAESERIAKIEAERIENERIRVENERLRIEAEAKEKLLAEERAKVERERKEVELKAATERKAAEAKLKAEREVARVAAEKAAAERAKIEAELKAKRDAEEKAKREALEAERKAKSAPDKEKLILLASKILNHELPEVQSQDAQKVIDDVKVLLEKISVFITKKVGEM